MGDNLPGLVNAGSTFRIITLTGNHRAGLSGGGPQGMDSQPIFINVDFDDESTWEITRGVTTASNVFYRFRVGGYGSIGHATGSTLVTTGPGKEGGHWPAQIRATNDARRDAQWIVTYVGAKQAYTIGLNPTGPQGLVWTVPPVAANNPEPGITIADYISPQLSDTQFFRFEEAPALAPAPAEADE